MRAAPHSACGLRAGRCCDKGTLPKERACDDVSGVGEGGGATRARVPAERGGRCRTCAPPGRQMARSTSRPPRLRDHALACGGTRTARTARCRARGTRPSASCAPRARSVRSKGSELAWARAAWWGRLPHTRANQGRLCCQKVLVWLSKRATSRPRATIGARACARRSRTFLLPLPAAGRKGGEGVERPPARVPVELPFGGSLRSGDEEQHRISAYAILLAQGPVARAVDSPDSDVAEIARCELVP